MLQSYFISIGNNPYPIDNMSHAAAIPYNFLMQLTLAPFIALLGPQLWIGRVFSIVLFVTMLYLVKHVLRKKCKLPMTFVGIGVTLAFLSQSITGHCFQKFHPNTLCIFLGMLSLVLVPGKNEAIYKWIPAFLLALLCFFAKQPGIAFFISVALCGLITKGKRILLLIILTIVAGGVVSLLANFLTDGGYWFYCYKMPGSYGFVWKHFQNAIYFIVTKCSFYFIFSFMAFLRVKNFRNPFVMVTPPSILFSVASFSMWGGTETNLSFCLIPLSITAAYGLYSVINNLPTISQARLSFLILLLIAFQIYASINIPSRISRADKETSYKVQSIFDDQKGEVLALAHGYHALRAGKKHYTSNEAIMQFRRMGITRFKKIEEKLAAKSFKLVVIMREYFETEAQSGDSILPIIQRNYSVMNEFDSKLANYPALILRPNKIK